MRLISYHTLGQNPSQTNRPRSANPGSRRPLPLITATVSTAKTGRTLNLARPCRVSIPPNHSNSDNGPGMDAGEPDRDHSRYRSSLVDRAESSGSSPLRPPSHPRASIHPIPLPHSSPSLRFYSTSQNSHRCNQRRRAHAIIARTISCARRVLQLREMVLLPSPGIVSDMGPALHRDPSSPGYPLPRAARNISPRIVTPSEAGESARTT